MSRRNRDRRAHNRQQAKRPPSNPIPEAQLAQLDAMLLAARFRPCILCGGAPDRVGTFIPYRPQAWGASPGKTRILVYSLCTACAATDDCRDRVENVFAANLGMSN